MTSCSPFVLCCSLGGPLPALLPPACLPHTMPRLVPPFLCLPSPCWSSTFDLPHPAFLCALPAPIFLLLLAALQLCSLPCPACLSPFYHIAPFPFWRLFYSVLFGTSGTISTCPHSFTCLPCPTFLPPSQDGGSTIHCVCLFVPPHPFGSYPCMLPCGGTDAFCAFTCPHLVVLPLCALLPCAFPPGLHP